MRVRKWRARTWAARLGLLALALNALVPIHLSFDLAAAFETPAHCGTPVAGDGAERHLLALLSGHHGASGKSDEHSKHHACPVCSTLGALAGFVPPTPICPVGSAPCRPAGDAVVSRKRICRRARRLPLPRSALGLSPPYP